MRPSQRGRGGRAGCRRRQPVSGARRFRLVEPNPGRDLLDELRVADLSGRALGDTLDHGLDVRSIGQDDWVDAWSPCRAFEQLQVGGLDRLAVVGRARALPLGQRVVKRRANRQRVLERDLDAIGPAVDVGVQAVGERATDEVLGRASQADEEVVIVGIDDRTPPRQIGKDAD